MVVARVHGEAAGSGDVAERPDVAGLLKANLVSLPSRDELLVKARGLFAATPSFEEIVDRAHDLIVRAVAMRLAAAAP